MKNDIVLIYSGGLDSTVLLYKLINDNFNIKTLTFNYGQKHSKEIQKASNICIHTNVKNTIIDLSNISSLINENCLINNYIDIPDGHYTEESMKTTVVPNRNMIMLSIAAGYAINNNIDMIAYAPHHGDHSIYPDCREIFIDSMRSVLNRCHYHPIRLYTPFSKINKSDIVKIGSILNVPFEKTWSCYKGLTKHCGKCATCVERIEAFKLSGIDDPTKYLL